MRAIMNFLRDESGSQVAEYGVAAAVMTGTSVAVVKGLQSGVKTSVEDTTSKIIDASTP